MSNIKKNYLYNLLYKIVTMLTPLITAPYIARVLKSDGVGEYSYTFSIAHYFLIFAMLGITDYGNRSIARVRDDFQKRSTVFSEIISIQFALSLVSSALYFGYALFGAESRTIAIIQGANVLSALFDVSWLFFGLELFAVTTIRNIAVKILCVVGILTFVKTPSDVWIYALIMASGTLASQLCMWPLLHKYVSFDKTITFSQVIVHLKPIMILFLPVIAANVLNYLDKIMLGKMATYSELGCYDNAEKLIQIPNSMVTALGAVMLPRMSNIVANGDENKTKKYMDSSMLFVLFSTFAFAFGMAAISKEFVPTFFGKGYELTISLVNILSPIMIFISVANVLKTQYLLPHCMDREFSICLVTGVCVNLVLNSIFIPKRGAIGASYATLIAEFLIVFFEISFVFKKIDLKDYLPDFIGFFISGLVMYLVIFSISITEYWATLVIKISVGAITYVCCSACYLFLFKRELLNEMRNKIRIKNK